MNVINIIFFVIVIMILSLSCTYLLNSYNSNYNIANINQKTHENFNPKVNAVNIETSQKEDDINKVVDSTINNVGEDVVDSTVQNVTEDVVKEPTYNCKKKWCSDLCPIYGRGPLGYWHPPRTDWSSFYHKTY